MPTLHEARFADLPAGVVEGIRALRGLDGRDREPTTRHLWLSDGNGDGDVIACLRLVADPDGTARVAGLATRADRRLEGHASRLLRAAVSTVRSAAVLDADAALVGWFERYGFAVSGPSHPEPGRSRVAMRRPARRVRRP